MRGAAYVRGCALLLTVVASVGFGAWRLRRCLLPGWNGAIARLAEAVVGVAVVLLVEQVLGAAGLLSVAPVVTGCAIAGLAIGLLARSPVADAPARTELRPPSADRGQQLVALAAVAVVAAQWAARAATAFDTGIVETDSITYHLPFAARFVQTASIAHLHYIAPDESTVFHPLNAELLHGIAILPFHRDVVIPLMNLGWLGLALLAGWCVGRPAGVGPASLVAVAVVLATPVLLVSQPGAATNDVAALALMLAAVALLLNANGERAALAASGLAAGLAIGTKLTVVAPTLVLALAALLAVPRARRVTAAVWALPLLLAGACWYVRNIVRIGNPLPTLHLGLGSVRLPSPRISLLDRFGFSVAHYLSDTDVWRRTFRPGLGLAFGPVWPFLLALAAAGALTAMVTGGSPTLRTVGMAAAVAGVVYVLTPTTAYGPEGHPVLFTQNLRYLAPSLTLGLAALPLAPALAHHRRRWWALAALSALLLALQTRAGPSAAWPGEHRRLAFVVALAVVAAGVFLPARRPRRRHGVVLASAIGLVSIGAVAAGWRVQDRYSERRYADASTPLGSVFAWAREVHHSRIAIAGLFKQYPLYGLDLSNRVQYVGHRGAHGAFTATVSCREWRTELNRGHYRFVVVAAPFAGQKRLPREARWTRSDPAANQVLRREGVSVFRLQGRMTPAGCA